MATKPSLTPDWAENTVDEPVIIDGNTILVTNKVEPTAGYKNSGELAREPLPRPYLNYQFNLINQWLKHLDERYSIGDFVNAATTETATTIGNRLGGVWTDHGTYSVTTSITGSVTMRLFEKTA